VGEKSLVEHALDAASGAVATVVVGPPEALPSDTRDGVQVVQEDPPFGGPVAAIAAGVAALGAAGRDAPELVLVLACDMPFAARAIPALLAAASADPDALGAWGVDGDGREQPLLAVYRAGLLGERLAELAAAGGLTGRSMRELTAGLAMVAVPVAWAAADADTWDDVERLRESHG